MKNAEITFTNTANPIRNQSKEKETVEKDRDKIKNNRKLEQLNRQQERLNKEKEKFKKVMARKVASKFMSIITAYNANDDPQYLWGQVQPTLNKMGLASMCQNNKTQIMDETEKDNRLYRILLRREARLEDDEIARLKREDDSLKDMVWSNDGMVVYVWAPYIAPPEATPEEEAPTP